MRGQKAAHRLMAISGAPEMASVQYGPCARLYAAALLRTAREGDRCRIATHTYLLHCRKIANRVRELSPLHSFDEREATIALLVSALNNDEVIQGFPPVEFPDLPDELKE